MAEDNVGLRKDYARDGAPWTKLFSAFKIALDPKKLLLAAAGILTMAVGWYVLSVLFYGISGKMPDWNPSNYPDMNDPGKREAAWKEFKRDRMTWNLLYEMAGAPPTKERADKTGVDVMWVQYDVADVAESAKEYEEITKATEEIRAALERLSENLALEVTATIPFLELKKPGIRIPVEVIKGDQEKLRTDLKDGKLTLKDLNITGKLENTVIYVGGYELKPLNPGKKDVDDLVSQAKAYKDAARTVEDIRAEVRDNRRNARITEKALSLRLPRFKPYGRLRAMPWDEDRGPNPYLLVTGGYAVTDADGSFRTFPWTRGQFARWLLGDQVPALLEPLVKFFRPLIYIFDPAAGFLNRVYLLLVILWSLATWALFGGAITRIAAVQVARTNERVGLMESLRFVWARYKSYFCAPLFPLVFLLVIVVILLLFGVFETYLFAVGDLVMPLLWPLVLLAGLVMAVVLVGLVGYPLMYSTISAEGSDSFDAISRSYSYVYQAPWQYLWYSFVALVYGMVLVFFIGFMGCLVVYLSKWSVGLSPHPDSREPSYLYMWAPTSYGWRDMLLHKSPNAKTEFEVNHRGDLVPVKTLATPKDYEPNWHNTWAAFWMSVWLYLLFLLVLGFSYSYFWTASTIIYLLMRRKVDDTELDEIHLEEEPEQPWTPPSTTTPAAEPPKATTTPVQMVESPVLRTAVTADQAPAKPAEPAPALHVPSAAESTPAAVPEPTHEPPPEGPPPEATPH